jgi:hypothetical protein
VAPANNAPQHRPAKTGTPNGISTGRPAVSSQDNGPSRPSDVQPARGLHASGRRDEGRSLRPGGDAAEAVHGLSPQRCPSSEPSESVVE